MMCGRLRATLPSSSVATSALSDSLDRAGLNQYLSRLTDELSCVSPHQLLALDAATIEALIDAIHPFPGHRLRLAEWLQRVRATARPEDAATVTADERRNWRVTLASLKDAASLRGSDARFAHLTHAQKIFADARGVHECRAPPPGIGGGMTPRTSAVRVLRQGHEFVLAFDGPVPNSPVTLAQSLRGDARAIAEPQGGARMAAADAELVALKAKRKARLARAAAQRAAAAARAKEAATSLSTAAPMPTAAPKPTAAPMPMAAPTPTAAPMPTAAYSSPAAPSSAAPAVSSPAPVATHPPRGRQAVLRTVHQRARARQEASRELVHVVRAPRPASSAAHAAPPWVDAVPSDRSCAPLSAFELEQRMYTASVQAKAKAPPPPPPPPPPPKTVYGQRAVRVHVPLEQKCELAVNKKSEPRHRTLDEAFAAAQEVTQAAANVVEMALETVSVATGETRPVATEAAAVAAQSGAVAWPTPAELVETVIDAAVKRAEAACTEDPSVKRAEAACTEDPSATKAQGPQEGATGEGEWPTQKAAEQTEWPTQEAEFVPPPARVRTMPTGRFGSALRTGHAEEADAWADGELLLEDDFEEVCEEVCVEDCYLRPAAQVLEANCMHRPAAQVLEANCMQPSVPVDASCTSPTSRVPPASAVAGDTAMDAGCGTEEDSTGIGALAGGGTRDTADDPVSREVARRMDLIQAALKQQEDEEEAW